MSTQTYLVEWYIDIEADTPEAAAREALTLQRDPESTATVFHVTNRHGETAAVDLGVVLEVKTDDLDQRLFQRMFDDVGNTPYQPDPDYKPLYTPSWGEDLMARYPWRYALALFLGAIGAGARWSVGGGAWYGAMHNVIAGWGAQ